MFIGHFRDIDSPHLSCAHLHCLGEVEKRGEHEVAYSPAPGPGQSVIQPCKNPASPEAADGENSINYGGKNTDMVSALLGCCPNKF